MIPRKTLAFEVSSGRNGRTKEEEGLFLPSNSRDTENTVLGELIIILK